MAIAETAQPTRKRRGKKTAAPKASPDLMEMTPFEAMPVPNGMEINLPDPEPVEVASGIEINPETGAVTIEHSDGSITIDPTGETLREIEADGDTDFDTNLALKIDSVELGRISEELLTAIQADKQDRSQWENMRAKTIELLGLKLEDPKADVSTSAMGMATSVVRDPVLLEAVERFRANAFAELCPAAGPVKVVDWGQETASTDSLANSLQKDLNYYLTTTASEYYPDTRYMLWWTGLASGTFKKVYRCPLRRRPVSEYVDGTNLIVPSNATDLKNAGRITHELSMRRSVMKRMQILKVYRNVDLTEPSMPVINPVEAKKANIEGKTAQSQRIEDQEYTVFEVYCELDIKGFEHMEDGEPSGLPLPYRVTIEEESRQILEIRRNWEENDEDQIAQIPFVLFPYSTGLSRIYGSGLGQMMGNMASALTAMMRISIDNGMLGNYPGTIRAKGTGRQLSNELAVPPGGSVEIDTGGMPIRDFIMPMPYKDVSANMVQYMAQLREVAQRLGGTADLPVGEGKQDAPVGTTLAMIEQATKIEGSVHKALHAAQSEEFRLLVRLFRDDPEALWRGNRRPAMGTASDDAAKQARIAKFKAALDNCDIVPASDPNVPSEMHRILKAMGLKQLTMGNPAYDQVAVDRRVAAIYKIDDFDSLLAKTGPQQPQVDPVAMAALQLKAQEVQIKRDQVALSAQKADKDRESKESIAAMQMAERAHASQQSGGTQPDPTQEAALQLKARQLAQGDARLAFDAHNAHAERQSKETIKAMDLAARLATHPESQPVVNEEMSDLSAYMQPAAVNGRAPLRSGGKVDDDDQDEFYDHKNVAHLLAEIERALSRSREYTTTNH